MLSDLLIGQTLEQIKALTNEDMLEEMGIELGPVRLKCALLPLKVVKVGAYGLADDPAAMEGEEEEEW